ncbi:hypothetical protein WDU94_008661 [Cyamophila willieti]
MDGSSYFGSLHQRPPKEKCAYFNKTTTNIFITAYEGIPQNLLLNVIAWLVKGTLMFPRHDSRCDREKSHRFVGRGRSGFRRPDYGRRVSPLSYTPVRCYPQAKPMRHHYLMGDLIQ